MKEPEAPTPTKEGKLAKQSKSAVKRAAKLAAQAGAVEMSPQLSGMSAHGGLTQDCTCIYSTHPSCTSLPVEPAWYA
jgi:hypothetical protein